MCVRGLLLRVTHHKATSSALDYFCVFGVFFLSVIKRILFIIRGFFFPETSTCFCSFLLILDACRTTCGFMVVIGNDALFFFYIL